MSKNFLNDLEIGKLGEELWAGWLVHMTDGEPEVPHQKLDWDVYDKKSGVYYEVKNDHKAYWWAERSNRPVNFFLEYETVKDKQPCGIMKTSASYLVYIIKNTQDLHIAYTFDLEKLRAYLWEAHENRRFRIATPKLNGVDNVRGWTPPVKTLTTEDKDKSGIIKVCLLPMSLREKYLEYEKLLQLHEEASSD